MLEQLTQLEGSILLWIQAYLRSGLLTPVMVGISKLGTSGAVWIALGVIMLFPKKTRKAGFLVLLALAVNFGICNLLLKPNIARIRPYDAIASLHCLVPAEHDFSFPSGHASAAFAGGVMIYKCCRKWFGVPMLIFAFLMGISRLYVGVHYPTDVICGALIGTAVALILFALFGPKEAKKRNKKRKKKKSNW